MTTRIESGKVSLPAEWVSELGLDGDVVLEKRPEGILIRPAPRVTWDEILKDRLPAMNSEIESEIKVTTDDLLF